MRRFTLSVLLALFTIAGMAAELNIYASGLRLHGASPVTGENQVHIDYFLNAPATDLKFVVLDATTGDEKTSVTIPAGTSNANYTKGLHEDVVVDLSAFFGAGETYKWAIKATGTTVASYGKVTDESTPYQFYGGRGVAVDNSYESDYLGRVYVTNYGGNSTMNNKRTTQTGVYAFDNGLNQINSSAYLGGITWGDNSGIQWAIARPNVGPDGTVYITSGSATNSGVWMMDPSNMSANFTPVFGGSHTSTGTTKNGDVTIHNSILHCYVEGLGAARKLYTYDLTTASAGGDILRYDIGTLESPWTAAQSATIYNDANNGNRIQGGDCSIAPDNHGGWWMSQYRAGTGSTSVPCLIHSTNGTIDYNAGTAILSNYQGGMAVSVDGAMLAIGTDRSSIKIYTVSYNGSNVPTLTLKTTVAWGTGRNAKGLAFDVANNLYAIDNNNEMFAAFAINSSTEHTTPAASSRTIVLESYIPEVHVTGVTLDETSKTVTVGESFTLTATVAPNDASDKTISWSTSNSNVATVADGVVTTKAVGTATITVTTTDGNKTATCDVTVDPKAPLAGTYNIGGDAPDFASLYEACDYINNWGISNNVTLLICADLTETHNSGIVNETDYTITIAPNEATKRTITFSGSDNVGPSGHIVIGYNLTGWASTDTKNVIIDGSYNNEGQYLEFRGGNVGGVVIVYYGHVTNSVVKNCRLINPRTSGTTYVAQFRTEQLAGGTPTASQKTDNAPTGVGFENCYMQVTGVTNSQAIYFNGSLSATAAGKPTNCYVRGCEITAKLRCIFFNGATNATIEGNKFHMPAASAGYLAHGIMGNAQSGTIVVRGNKFIEMATTNAASGAYGIQAITASGGATKWIIENNYFAGLNATASGTISDKDFALTYVRCGDLCELRHNTFYMPSLTKKPGTALMSATPITCVYLAGTAEHVVKNNIFVSAETEANISLIRGSLNANVLNNVYYHNDGNAAILAGAETKTTWDEFTAGGANAGSVWNNPAFVNAAEGDLRLTISDETLKMARLDEVLTDIEGTSRPNPTFAGAHELIPVDVTSVTINATDMVLAPGAVKTLTAEVLPDNTTYTNLTWASDNAAVTINPTTGQLTAVSAGTAHITATIGGVTSDAITVEVSNPVAHILPYDLNRTLNGDQNSYTFTFKSNIAATSGKILFYQGGVYKGEVTITDPIVAGENSVYVAKTSLPQIDGVMTWAVQLTAAENKVIAEMTDESAGIYNFYLPQGLAIDNSPESSWFGNIYITQPVNGASDGMTTRTKNQQAGLFVYDPLLNELNTTNQGYSMGVTLPAANRHGFKRVNVDAQGNVYVNSGSAIYKASPADFTTSTTLAESKFTAINSFCMDGDIFYVMDNGTALKQLQGGTTTEIMSDASRLVSNAATDNTVLQDGLGGWWIAQGRANADIYYSLLHVNASSHAIDFSIYNNNNANLLSDCNPKSTRGAIALNSDKTILALGSNSSVIFFDIVYDGDGTPTITRKNWILPTLGYNIDGVAFDYADNLYVVSASVERLYMFTLPKADNTTLVPAKSTLTVDAQEHIAVTSITLSQTSASLEIGEGLDLVATCLPATATDKTVEWSSDNTSVAEVNPTTGHVTAVGVGTAHIKATSTADAVESESCEITVYTLDFNVTWETNGATYTTTLLSSNADLWSQFMTGYNTYYVAKGKSARAIQPMTAVATFAWWGVIDLLTDPVSPWKWLGDYMLKTADAQSVALTTETEWTTALQDFFSCTAVIVDFATAGQVAQWLPLWKDANNYLPATMRAEDAMPTIRRGAYTFMGWYDNSECTGTPVASVTADITLYALWYAPLTLDETAANADNIAANNGRTINVTFNRRFTVADGWYTLVLPFDLTAAQMAEAFGADYRLCELETSYLKSETMMYLRFRDVDDLEAGKPYLFKTGVDITDDIVFNAVTINNATPQVVTDKVTMIGLYDQTVVGASDLNYYLGYEDYLYEYLTDKTTKAFRCYFHFASPSLIQGRNARVIFRDDVTTDLEDETFETAPAVQKIIRNGQLIIIRDGVEYNAQGQVIK